MHEHGRNGSDRGSSLGSGCGGNRRVCGFEGPHGEGGGGVSPSRIASDFVAPVTSGFYREHGRKGGQVIGMGLSNYRGAIIR